MQLNLNFLNWKLRFYCILYWNLNFVSSSAVKFERSVGTENEDFIETSTEIQLFTALKQSFVDSSCAVEFEFSALKTKVLLNSLLKSKDFIEFLTEIYYRVFATFIDFFNEF